MVPTKQGIIDYEIVEKYKEEHQKAIKDGGLNVAGGDTETSTAVNSISSNQTQEYFAIATNQGFEIL